MSARVLVAGPKFWPERGRPTIARELEKARPSCLIVAGNKGPAWAAKRWGIEHRIPVESYLADPHKGEERERRMIREGQPQRALVFGELFDRGLQNRVGDFAERILAARIPVRWIRTSISTPLDLAGMPGPEARP